MKKFYVTTGLGVDITNSERFLKLILNKKKTFINKFAEKILHSEHEYSDYMRMMSNKKFKECSVFLGTIWALKEALFKSLDKDLQKNFKFKNWYRTHNNLGMPILKSDLGYNVYEKYILSVSHEKNLILASVLRQKLVEID